MKLNSASLEGALVVRFYEGIDGPFPVEIGAAVAGSSLSIVVRPSVEPVALDPVGEESLGVSLLEAEATGLSAAKVCDQLNALLAGRRVSCSSRAEAEAIACLFATAASEAEFVLSPHEQCVRKSAAASANDLYLDSIARDYLVTARPLQSLRAR